MLTLPADSLSMQVAQFGQSPGVPLTKPGQRPTPLHVVHTVKLRADDSEGGVTFQWLRVFVVRPATGWGVSLWQLDLLPPT